MCEFCTEHGEGKKWYLVMRNYSRELWEADGRKEFAEHFWSQFENYTRPMRLVDRFKNIPLAGYIARLYAQRKTRIEHFGQIVPLEDVEQILDMQSSVVRLPCECRRMVTGKDNARYCFGLGVDRTGILGKYPDLARDLEVLDTEEAKQVIRSFDAEGFTHSVWTMKTPYISTLCNCDRDCLAYRVNVKTGIFKNMFRAEYVAVADRELCSGCKKCAALCRFDAIHYSASDGTPVIDASRCWGCGLCRNACENGAITLKSRYEFSGLPW